VDINTAGKELNKQPHEEARVKKQQQEIHRKKKKYTGVEAPK
jgi:hypothetical protein